MARASWKYLYFREKDINSYIEHLTENYTEISDHPARHITINKLNYHGIYNLYTGKWTFEKTFSLQHVGFKLGQFTKTRKPYYFRSKKKKCYKKKVIIILI